LAPPAIAGLAPKLRPLTRETHPNALGSFA
jgi:hypothetical protein